MATAAKAGPGTNGLVDSPIQHESGRSAALALITWGALVGLLTGVPFQLGNMIFATTQGMPPVAPFLGMSTIFNFTAKPSMAAADLPIELVTGLWTHLSLSILFGVGFALIATVLRGRGSLALAGLGYGIALYIFNFQILGRTLFPAFTDPMGPNQIFEFFLHAGYGLLLVPFFVGRVGRSSTAST